MFEEFKFKTELHAHTSPASGCSEIQPEYLIEVYKKMGYTSVAVTNHFTFHEDVTDIKAKIDSYLDDYYKTLEFGKKEGLNVLLGAEIRFSENYNDYLVYGISEEDLYTIEGLLSKGIDNFYKEFKSDRNLIFQAHPFRNGMEPVNPESLDGIEVYNLHPGHNSRVGLAAQYAKEHDFLIIGGTDYHHFGHEGLGGIFTKEPVTDSFMLAKILKNKEYLLNVGGFKAMPE